MLVSMIAAMSPNRVIGKPGGGIPWSLPRDKQHFRGYTAEKWMLVGRSTYQEMEGWFGNRAPIVLTSDSSYSTESPAHRVASSVTEGIRIAEKNGAEELVVTGGASVYTAALPYAERLILTIVETEIAEGSRFPPFQDSDHWSLVHRESWPADEKNELAMCLQILNRKK